MPNMSIHPNPRKWDRKRREKKKAQYLKNRQMRAALNQEFQGANGSNKAGEYHLRLKSLSKGTA